MSFPNCRIVSHPHCMNRKISHFPKTRIISTIQPKEGKKSFAPKNYVQLRYIVSKYAHSYSGLLVGG